MEYTVKKAKRKTAGIYITETAEIEVRVPAAVSASWIEFFVEEKRDWIERQLSLKKKQLELKHSFALTAGETLNLLGEPYILRIRTEPPFGFINGACYLPENCPDLKKAVIEWYKKEAKSIIEQRVALYQERMGCYASAVKINAAKTRWGSCSGKNSLNFSWKLVMAPLKTVDYVVIHELAHTVEHNHSKNFWNIVRRIMPDYKAEKNNLLTLQKKLSIENWD